MGRYTGPKTKISRRYGVQIFGPSKSLERKNYPPGMHGPKGSRRKQSDYAIALGEKQKLRYQYGLLERQFRRIFQNALRKGGDEIAIKDKPKSRQLALRNLELTQIVPVPDWLTVDREALKGKVAHIPSREEMQPIVNEQLIVELYSR